MNASRRQMLLTSCASLASIPALANYSYETPAEKIAHNFIEIFQKKTDLNNYDIIEVFDDNMIPKYHDNYIGIYGFVETDNEFPHWIGSSSKWIESKCSINDVFSAISNELQKNFESEITYKKTYAKLILRNKRIK